MTILKGQLKSNKERALRFNLYTYWM